MHEILSDLPVGSYVLDLGCAAGSFSLDATSANVVRVDRLPPAGPDSVTNFVQADATNLPFADRTFAGVISNHSLEHFDNLTGALHEIGRVVTSGGSLFIAVPDASTLTDRLYRWLARGGGHVNSFVSARETAAVIGQATGLPHVATKLLCSSLSFLNRRNAPRPIPRRLWLLGAGYEWSLFLYVWLSRRMDRWLDKRSSVYGWAFYFGEIGRSIDRDTWFNVCIRCGSGCSAASLRGQGLVRSKFPGLDVWRCPACGAFNPFSEDAVP